MLTPLDDDDNFPGSHLFYRLHLSVVTITNAFQASEEKVLPQRDGQSAKSSNNSERKVLKLEQDEKSPPPHRPFPPKNITREVVKWTRWSFRALYLYIICFIVSFIHISLLLPFLLLLRAFYQFQFFVFNAKHCIMGVLIGEIMRHIHFASFFFVQE